MNQQEIETFFAILRTAINGNRQSSEALKNCDSVQMTKFLNLSAQHDLKHLLVLGLKQNGLITEETRNMEECIFKTVCRYENLQFEYRHLCDALEKSQIVFLPLKGAVMREYYPKAWMRTSCDIDVLIHEKDIMKAETVLTETCGYQRHLKGSHDISFFTPKHVHVELHYDLIEDDSAGKSSEVLKNLWEHVSVCKGFSYRYEMSDAMFYFYHIAHMAKHFENGGCGIRPFMDLWILDRILDVDVEMRDRLLEQGGLLKFATAARKLSRVWFAGDEYDSVSRQLETYVLQGGVYGKMENRVAVQQQKQGGRWKYAASKIFISYDVIKFQYPVLQKHRWLLPLMEVRRWGRLLFCGHAKRVVLELEYNKNISKGTVEDMQQLLKEIGLQQ